MTTGAEQEPDRFDLIIASRGINGPEFGQQTNLIKSSGADFNPHSRTWSLPLERALAGDKPGLETLFQAAREYGTSVWLQRRQPGQGFVSSPE